MDVTCLKPLDFKEGYVFRSHHSLPLVGNVMKCPQGSELMKRCYEEASEKVDAYNRDWHLPIQILVDNVRSMGLDSYVRNFSNEDSWNVVRRMLAGNINVPDTWFVIHWVNEEWRRNEIGKHEFIKSSLFSNLAERNGVQIDYAGTMKGVVAKFKLSKVWHGLKHL